MTRLEIATLACKLLALWFFVQTAMSLSGILLMVVLAVSQVFNGGNTQWYDLLNAAMSGVPALVEVGFGLFLWFKAPSLARRMVSDDPTPVTRPDITHDTVLAVALTAVGVFLLVPVVRGLASTIFTMLFTKELFSEFWDDVRWQASLWSSIIQLGLALWLILGSRGIVRLILSLRQPDAETKPEDAG